MSGNFCLNADFHVTFRDILHAVKLRHGTDGFTSPPKEGLLRIFRPKNPTASAGCEPANLGTKGQHANSRPPKPQASTLKLEAVSFSEILKHFFRSTLQKMTIFKLYIVHETAVYRNPHIYTVLLDTEKLVRSLIYRQ